MLNNYLLKKSLIVGIITILILSSFISTISGYSNVTNQYGTVTLDDLSLQGDGLVECCTFGLPGKPSQKSSIPLDEAELLLDKFKELQIKTSLDPFSEETQNLQIEIINLAKKYNLVSKSVSTDKILKRLTPLNTINFPILSTPLEPGRGTETFCNYVSWGVGSALPIIILPRLVPILLTPIPRLFVKWSTYDGVTSCGGLRSGKGFIAYGAQNGLALGFWGIGFSIFLPPVMAYGLLGYALYVSVNAEDVEPWPPNYPPVITMLNPPDGAENIPIATNELSFHISDRNKALMNYTVTTFPDVGLGSGSNLIDGTYTVPISGLEGTEKYTWQIQLDDGVNNVDVTSAFTTEAVAPIVSNPKPVDGKMNVLLELSQLNFYLEDPQGDLMDYTVETSPDIGSGSGTDVSEGLYNINIDGLDFSQKYKWFVNVTDGTYWKHKVFYFTTRPVPGIWWNDKWLYRKEIIINFSMIEGDLDNFPVLISLESDSDLTTHAQDDGDDIVFTDYQSNKMNHENELFDSENGDLIVWVNVTKLRPDTIIYMYYGNLNCTNQQLPEKVWDESYEAVYHMQDKNDEIEDSTKNKHDGKKSGGIPTEKNGKIGLCQVFDENQGDYININNFKLSSTHGMSLEAWIKFERKNGSAGMGIVAKDGGLEGNNRYWNIHLAEYGQDYYAKVYFSPNLGITPIRAQGSTRLIPNIWYYIAGVFDDPGDALYIYLNNILEDYTSSSFHLNTGFQNIWIGTKGDVGYFNGFIDEVRISAIARNPLWIKTSYNTMNEPSNFLTVGAEVISS